MDALEWQAWIRLHARTFGMHSEAELAMLAEWSRLFAQAGFCPLELQEATDWLAVHEPPRGRVDQLRELQARVRSCRARGRDMGAAGARDADAYACPVCDGNGTVAVPHEHARGGCHVEGPWVEAVVFCTCHVGQRMWQAWSAAGKRPTSLEQYERRYPDWREKMRRRAEFLRMQRRADAQSGHLDATLGPLSWLNGVHLPRGGRGERQEGVNGES